LDRNLNEVVGQLNPDEGNRPNLWRVHHKWGEGRMMNSVIVR